MLLHTCGNGKHIRVEDYVERIHTYFLGKKLIGTTSYLYPPFISSGLTYLVKAHHHHSSTISHHVAGMTQKHLLTLFQRDRIYDALALHTLQSGSYHVPLRRVNHYRHLRNIRFRGYDI